MRLQTVEKTNNPFMKKTKVLKYLEEFQRMDVPMVEVVGWEENYANPSSAQASFSASIKRFKLSCIECRAKDKRVYLINKALYKEEEK